MYDVDVEQFWKDDDIAHKDNCFTTEAPQAALGIRMSDECVFAELSEEGDPWGPPLPRERRMELNKRYNDLAEKIVGKRLLREWVEYDDEHFPEINRIGTIYGGVYEFKSGTEWLSGTLSTPGELEKRLDFVDKLDFESFVLPDHWYKEKKRIFEKYGKKPNSLRHIRGPVTLAMSVYGSENLIYLMMDAPELAKRFSDSIADVILKYVTLFDREADLHEEGFSFADDQCCMLNPELYEFFGYPILKKVFETVSPTDGKRYQHSDSDMGHLIPLLGKLNFTGVNFGPNIMVQDIRPHMPKARIDGCLAPFTFMRNDHEGIIREIRRDADAARGIGGLNVSTAGSINNGSTLESMRVAMYAIQKYGRY